MNLQELVPIAMNVSLFLNIFAIGLRASAQDVTYFFRRPTELVRALLAMNVLMPLFTVVLVSIFDLDPAVKTALVALSVSPIPPLLPNRVVKAGGHNSYAIGLFISLGLLAIIFVPLAMEIIELVSEVPLQMSPASIATIIFMTALLPLGLGVAVHKVAPAFSERIAKPISLISVVALLVCLVVILFVAAPSVWALVGNGTIIALATFVLVGLGVGHLLGGPEPEHRSALGIATASRHPGIAVAIAMANRPQQKLAMGAVLLYLIVNLLLLLPYHFWSKRQQLEAEKQVKA